MAVTLPQAKEPDAWQPFMRVTQRHRTARGAGCDAGRCKAVNLLRFDPDQMLKKGASMSDSTSPNASAQEKLVSDIRAVIADAEEILLATADQTGEKIASLRGRIRERMLDARIRLDEAEAVLVEKTRAAARATDDYVHENPWQAVGIGAGVGLLLGLLLGRR
jgi:ElaB/YqjD/DUF883 family membrane-anchored ribosome-binding protein